MLVEHRAGARPWRYRGIDALLLPILFAVAFGVRLGVILGSPGGLGGNLGDDSSAYYAGADAIVHGRLPYRDFVLLHPPLLDLLLTPFAAVGALTSDHAGFMAATVATELFGALSAVLVVVVGRRAGFTRPAAYTGGAFYALWYGAVAAEVGIRLEATASLICLLGFLALTGEDRRRNAFLGGAAFGAAASVKIWGVVPVLVLLVWFLLHRRTRRSAPVFAAGAVAAAVVACGPFFVAAPATMWHMVVTDQLGRPYDHRLRADRLTGLHDVFPTWHGSSLNATLTAIGLAVAVTFVLAARVPVARPIVALALAELIVLYVSPSFFSNYAGFAAAASALAVGAAVQSALTAGRLAAPVRAIGTVAVAATALGAATLTVVALTDVPIGIGSLPFPHALMARVVAGAHCPTPEGPIVLIETNTLSSTLADGCPNWVDVSGKLYVIGQDQPGTGLSRARNRPWQAALRRYLFSGDVTVLFRPRLGIGRKLRRELLSHPVIGVSDGYVAVRLRPS